MSVGMYPSIFRSRIWRRFKAEWDLQGILDELAAAYDSPQRHDPNPHRRASYERYIEMLEQSRDAIQRELSELR
jgi:hypothetical protein